MISDDHDDGWECPVCVRCIEVWVFRCPIENPVQTSFGVMNDRAAVFVRVTDRHGSQGWGEIWCNFPSVGAEHRARLVQSVLAPLLLGRELTSPFEGFADLTRATRVLALQSGEAGPIAQCIAGIDIALWDLVARRAGIPLWRFLGGQSGRVNVYASGLNPTSPEVLASQCRSQGFRAFKLKVGFGMARDIRNLRALRDALGKECVLMVDANQAWDFGTAIEMAERMHQFDLDWLEEPVPADTPWEIWRDISERSRIPLAAGENLRDSPSFDAAIKSGALSVIQPDIAKWGGVSGCLPVARRIVTAGLRYCPHYLGGGIGLRASAHLLAAAGGDGALEMDVNPNPLREALLEPSWRPASGTCIIDETPGLGDFPALFSDPMNRWLTLRLQSTCP